MPTLPVALLAAFLTTAASAAAVCLRHAVRLKLKVDAARSTMSAFAGPELSETSYPRPAGCASSDSAA